MTISKRKLYATLMTYDVSDDEKDKASKAIRHFDGLLKTIKYCDEHLNLIYTPFKDNQEVSPEQTFKARAALRRYRDKVVENFNTFKKQAFRCFILLQPFSVDTQIVKLVKSFVLSIDDIEKQVNRFVDLFSNLEAKDFPQGIVKSVEGIKKELAEIKQIIEDRIQTHIQNNILARNWIDNVSDELQEKIEKQIPYSVELVNMRNEEEKK
jgi:hypothetical protein